MTGFGVINYVVLGIYLLSVLGIGVYFSKRSGKDTDNFFKAGGRVPGWAVGISIFATTLSAITFMSTPAKTYRTDWAFMGNNFAIVAITPLVIAFFVPFIRKLKVTTAYEYLEHIFDFKTRSLSSIIFMYYEMVGVSVSFIGGYLFSFLFKNKKNIKGLTYSTINEEVVS